MGSSRAVLCVSVCTLLALAAPLSVTTSAQNLPPTPRPAAPRPTAAAPTGLDATVPSHWFGPGPTHKVVLSHDDPATHTVRNSPGLLREINYGTFSLFVVDETLFGGRDALSTAPLPFRDEFDLLPLNGFLLNGTRPELTLAALPANQRLGVNDGPLDPTAGLYLVQFVGPLRDRWLAQLTGSGARVVQYMPFNAYVVSARPNDVPHLSALAETMGEIQYVGEWQPAFRMSPTVRAAAQRLVGTPYPVTIQVVDGDGVRDFMDALSASAEIIQSWPAGPYLNVEADVDPGLFEALANQPQVFAIEERGERRTFDERQGMILANQVSGATVNGPGYLAWLAGKGFNSSQFASFSVNIVDDATTLLGHPDIPNSRVDFALNPTNQSSTQGGHGFLNGHIVGGFNSSTAGSLNDSGGFNYGLGIAPWAHVGATAIFGGTSSSGSTWESQAYAQGARISNNSWGFSSGGGPLADYNASAQSYDFIVRDARSGQSGNQQYTVIFAAGNDGPGSNTVSSPSTAKNVITVGASENDRQTGSDGCGVSNSGANDVRDLINFSSHGPVNSTGGDGRWKPEIVAPGTHIEAGIPQSNYNGSSVCNQFWPGGQTLYGWSSGTSHSAPAVAGGAALVRQDFANQALGTPSPAMIKAWLVASARYINGAFAGGNLPSNSQGMGRMNLDKAFDSTAKLIVDQTQVLSTSGASYQLTGNVADASTNFRVTLVWTDAPGPTSGAPWVNDLDLTVSAGGSTYKGNVFSGKDSVAGGSADFRNNTESVRLPVGTSGPFTVTVTASSLGGDGVPGNGDATDQDFALLVTNGSTVGTGAPVSAFSASPTSGTAPLVVAFTDQSTGSVTSWTWSFGDGGSSSAQNPSHTYNGAGTYSVSLIASGPGGNDVETKSGLITVTTGGTTGLDDGSFEGQTSGSTPSSPWAVAFGAGHVINPAGGTTSDGGMPSAASKWCEIGADSTDGATPPSNPGGVTAPPVGGAGVSQSFSYPAGNTILEFAAVFLRNENANQSQFNDWMSVDISDGSTTRNLFYKDTFSPTSGTSSKFGYAKTALETVSVDLAVIFPGSSTSTNFSLTALVGNGFDTVQPSRGYVDGFLLKAPITAPVANFSGSPTSGVAPLSVAFSDLSTGSISSRTWSFGDGGSSNAVNPSRTYTSAGNYTVSLITTGPGGSDSEVKLGYITVANPPVAGLSDGSFENQSAGSAPSAPWTITAGAAHKIDPSGATTSDGGMPGQGAQWCDLGADGSNGATPPSNPGGVTNPPVGARGISQTFSYPAGQTELSFDAVFLRNEDPNQTQYNDFMTVDISDGSTTLNLFYADTFSATSGTSAQYGFAKTALAGVSVDLATAFPGSTTATGFTFTAQVGNGFDNFQPSRGYIDDVRLDAPSVPAPVADFSASTTSGSAPLTVGFNDQSSGSVTNWSWTFGDGGTSNAQNPGHTYSTAGTYTVALIATGPGGFDSEVKSGYITVSPPPVGGDGISDGSFENQTAGSAPSGPWSTVFGTGHVVNPAGASSDGPLPTHGSQWGEVAGDSTNAASPPSNPGGVTNPPVGGAGLSQTFRYESGSTWLSMQAAFLRNEDPDETQYNDWMSVDITDGSTTVNLFYADTFSATPLISAKYGYAMTALTAVSANLATMFPASTTSTDFTLTVLVGNGFDNFQPSKGYVDRVQLSNTGTVPAPGGNTLGQKSRINSDL